MPSVEHPNRESALLRYEFGPDEPFTQAVVKAVAEVSECKPVISVTHRNNEEALDPIYEAIDPDALNSVFGLSESGRRQSNGTITFPYSSYQVTVSSSGLVRIEEQDE